MTTLPIANANAEPCLEFDCFLSAIGNASSSAHAIARARAYAYSLTLEQEISLRLKAQAYYPDLGIWNDTLANLLGSMATTLFWSCQEDKELHANHSRVCRYTNT